GGLGANMAAVGRRKLARFGSVRVEVAAFEDWPLPSQAFDMVLAATAFHWLDPAVRVGKCADALREGGALATVATHHIAGGDAEFFAAAQTCYARWDPATPPALRLQSAADIPRDADELDRPERSGPAVSHLGDWEATYPASDS